MRRATIFLPLLLLTVVTTGAHAQQESVISVTARGEVELPADLIRFTINLNAEAESPQQAYDLHKKRERVLVRLLDKYDIKDDQIRFEPISIQTVTTNRYEGSDRVKTYRTSQQVTLTLEDFTVYEKMQVTLVENDFDQFSGNFLSSEQKSGEDKALRRAMQEARRKAEIIASEGNIELASIQSVNHHENRFFPGRQRETMAMAAPDQQSLMNYDQTVVIEATVNVQYSILKKIPQ
ncbi:MAG: SIMPL domain-containing protein [Balneolaceae bacterium]|nr:SIMPL domain-containing protein [Balneolaceae bacterium]